MNKIGLKAVCAILFTLMLATACSSEKSSGPNDAGKPSSTENAKTVEPKGEAPKTAIPAIDKPTKLTVYHQWGLTTDGFMDLWGKYIVKKYPNLTFQVLNEKDGNLNDFVLTNVNVDLIIHTELNLSMMKDLGLDTDLSDLIKKYNYDLGLWEPSVAKYIQEFNDGKIPSMPLSLQTLAFYYNRNLFSKFGVPFPSDKITWDDVQEMSTKMTREDGGVMYWGYDTQNTGTKLLINPFSMPIVDPVTDKAAFETDKWKSYLSKMVSVARIPGIDRYEKNKLDLFIKEERLAMTTTMSTNTSMFAQNPSLDWDIANYPTLKELSGVGPQAEIVMFYIPDNSKNREAAFVAAMETASVEVQRERSMDGDMSILRDPEMRNVFGSRLAELKGKNAKALIPTQLAEKMPYSKYINTGRGQLEKAYSELLAGTTDINSALRTAAEETNKKIDELKQAESK